MIDAAVFSLFEKNKANDIGSLGIRELEFTTAYQDVFANLWAP